MKSIVKNSLLLVFFVFISTCIASPLFAEYFPGKRWRTSKPERQEMDSETLFRISDAVKSNYSLGVTSILIIRNGYIVYEEYFREDEDTLRSLYSATKVFTGASIGIAIDHDIITDVDAKMLDYLPEFNTDEFNINMKEITIENLLTMTAGLGVSDLGNLTKEEIVKYLMNSYSDLPGKKFQYTNTCSHLLSLILTEETGISLADFTDENLFGPIGIQNFQWHSVGDSTAGANGLRITTRDMAKIGYLYLKNGKWGKKQIISPEWIRESTSHKISVDEPPTSSFSKSEDSSKWAYGYQWWIPPKSLFKGYMAIGSYGQFICVLPELEIVAVITGNEPMNSRSFMNYMEVIEDFIIPSVY